MSLLRVLGSVWIWPLYCPLLNHMWKKKDIEDLQCKEFLLRCFSILWTLAPCLEECQRNGLKKAVGKRPLTMKAYCKERFRINCSNILNKMASSMSAMWHVMKDIHFCIFFSLCLQLYCKIMIAWEVGFEITRVSTIQRFIHSFTFFFIRT